MQFGSAVFFLSINELMNFEINCATAAADDDGWGPKYQNKY